ncbi:hypothetical protein [Candidatus Poriferisodalis sp.]|uniref:hypothetical protein n=1 Tax=Candidatus Poriferisodalis sp. TaxID=3101277 RepID=UPI003B52DFBC
MSLINVARFSADELYEIVATYAGFGNHHTGTPVDAQTTAWLKDVLLSLGASVHEDWFEFDRFVCTAELRVGDQVVPALPVFYSAHGDWRTKDLSVVEANVAVGERGTGLAVALAMAAELAADHHVTLSACSGHEFDHIGLKHYLAGREVVGWPVVHLGGSSLFHTTADTAAATTPQAMALAADVAIDAARLFLDSHR